MPNISIPRLAELERAEKRLIDLEQQKTIAWLGVALGNALAITLANKPYSKWSSNQKMLLHAVAGNATTALALYIDSLPKD